MHSPEGGRKLLRRELSYRIWHTVDCLGEKSLTHLCNEPNSVGIISSNAELFSNVIANGEAKQNYS